ncbi:hypothetical protein N7456_011084 [Penicillium angulare]|uniref:Uncharacterized protein n=1 Tax=Penicillium angulare TaxID=116970 RepID=A0A9W9ET02_9EURO|nr:hypothetical protein N7456_011084 [Penicillium angulare]
MEPETPRLGEDRRKAPQAGGTQRKTLKPGQEDQPTSTELGLPCTMEGSNVQHDDQEIPEHTSSTEEALSNHKPEATTKARWKVCIDYPINEKDGTWTEPPYGCLLSDELVYLLIKTCSPERRSEKYPDTFDSNGDIRIDRTPMDPAPLGLAFGLAFFYIYKGYYVLCGNKYAHIMGLRQIRPKSEGISKKYPTCFIGAVVAPDTFVLEKRSVTRQFYTATSVNASYVIESEGEGNYDTVGTMHNQGALYWTGEKLAIRELFRFEGYNIRCGPGPDDTVEIIPRHTFNGTDFNYDRALLRPYLTPEQRMRSNINCRRVLTIEPQMRAVETLIHNLNHSQEPDSMLHDLPEDVQRMWMERTSGGTEYNAQAVFELRKWLRQLMDDTLVGLWPSEIDASGPIRPRSTVKKPWPRTDST